MDIVRNAQKRLRPHPFLYRLFTYIYVVYGEVTFFFHALLTGKLSSRFRGDPFPGLVSKQTIISYPLPDIAFNTIDHFREWLKKEGFRFQEGGWTFYIPPQRALQKHFAFLAPSYPQGAGLKILKDFRHPDSAKYARHMQSPAPGAALKRFLTPLPKLLVRVANYLYFHGLGMRVYDLIALKGLDLTLSAYVVEHLEGAPVTQKHYEGFMQQMRGLLYRKELMTVHESVDIMADFAPPDCSGNLILDRGTGRPVYVDFQGFIFRDEGRLLKKQFERTGEILSFPSPWNIFLEMMKEKGCSLEGKVVYEVSLSGRSFLYQALSQGAQWAVGWYPSEAVLPLRRILLSLGMTRFDLHQVEPTDVRPFNPDAPERYKKREEGILIIPASGDISSLWPRILELPWEFMLYQGPDPGSDRKKSKPSDQASWLKDVQVISSRRFRMDAGRENTALLMKRKRAE